MRREFLKLSGVLPVSIAGVIGSSESENAGVHGKRSVYYWNLQSPPEGLEEAVRILNDLGADFIWYAHWVLGFPLPPDFEQALEIARNCGLGKRAKIFADWCRREFYSLECIKKQVNAVRGKIYCPAILGYTNFRVDFNFDPVSFEPLEREEIESWLLDFGKWDIKNPETGKTFTVEETQEIFRKMGLPLGRGIPDFSNPDVVKYYVKKAIALKKAGVNAVWYDTFFQLPLKIRNYLNLSFYSPVVKDLFRGCVKIVSGAKALGLITGTWHICFDFPYRVPELDFVCASPTPEEVMKMKLDDGRWKDIERKIIEKSPETELLIVFDFAGRDNTPLAIFSQNLTPEEEQKFLRLVHDLSLKLDVESSVAYPVHGLGIGAHPEKLAWGKYRIYDARAPEFNTYRTIAELISENSGHTANTHRIPVASILPPASLLLACFLKSALKQGKRKN